ncbi:hypothetical protein [Humidisolicoccus flavus]|uniref:hypothetical protein n=1 Tax=Humidisolicoccus flavus TaxID=3111414 RepID=UPI003248DD45
MTTPVVERSYDANRSPASKAHGFSPRRLLALGLSATLATATLALIAPAAATAAPQSQTFTDPAGTAFVVPEGITSLTATVAGASGGDSGYQGPTFLGGAGAVLTVVIDVTPGETLTVFGSTRGRTGYSSFGIVDGAGGSGFKNGGSGGRSEYIDSWGSGGGGSSAILRGETLLVAAGGGGGASGQTVDANIGNAGLDADSGSATNEEGTGLPGETVPPLRDLGAGGGGGGGFVGGAGGTLPDESAGNVPNVGAGGGGGDSYVEASLTEIAERGSNRDAGSVTLNWVPALVTTTTISAPTTVETEQTFDLLVTVVSDDGVTGNPEEPVETEPPVSPEPTLPSEEPSLPPVQVFALGPVPEGSIDLFAGTTLLGNQPLADGVADFSGMVSFATAGTVTLRAVYVPNDVSVFEASEAEQDILVTRPVIETPGPSEEPAPSEEPVVTEPPAETPEASAPETSAPGAGTPGITAPAPTASAPAATPAAGSANLPNTGGGAELTALLAGALLLLMFGAAVRMRANDKHRS